MISWEQISSKKLWIWKLKVATFKILSEDAVQKSEKATSIKLCYPATADLLSPCQPRGGWGPCNRIQKSEAGTA